MMLALWGLVSKLRPAMLMMLALWDLVSKLR